MSISPYFFLDLIQFRPLGQKRNNFVGFLDYLSMHLLINVYKKRRLYQYFKSWENSKAQIWYVLPTYINSNNLYTYLRTYLGLQVGTSYMKYHVECVEIILKKRLKVAIRIKASSSQLLCTFDKVSRAKRGRSSKKQD